MLLSRLARCHCSQIKVPTLDISNYLNQTGNWQKDCQELAQNFHKYGLVIINDPRVDASHNNRFLDMMENYFTLRSQQFDQGNTTIDFAPWSNFQVGIMHQNQQKFQSYKQDKLKLKDPHKAVTPLEPISDPKWRFHWKVGYDKNVIPEDFLQWQCIMDQWGNCMKSGCLTVAQMIAVGLGLQKNYLTDTIVNGAFHLAPTAVDLQKTKKGDVLAAFHRDFSLLTIHGQSRYPGLFAWLTSGERFQVKVPQGYLLLQAGKQLEWFTGGHIKAGFHEVIYSEDAQKAKIQAKQQGLPLWRISSTMFSQVEETVEMQPHPKYQTAQSARKYPRISAYDYLTRELYSLTGKE